MAGSSFRGLNLQRIAADDARDGTAGLPPWLGSDPALRHNAHTDALHLLAESLGQPPRR